MTDYTEALHKAADFLAKNDDLFGINWWETKAHFDGEDLGIFIPSMAEKGGKIDQKATLRRVVKALGGTFQKDAGGSTMYLRQEGVFGFFGVTIYVDRDNVCERVLVGSKDVVVPAVEAAPERIDTVPEYEWECKSIFADEKELVSA